MVCMRIVIVIFILKSTALLAQTEFPFGRVSFGMRSTVSAFSDDGDGLGTGGQFRVQLSERVNTDWYADYIQIAVKDQVRSYFYHIGWSVLFYPWKSPLGKSHRIQPYVLAGHCFDYNEKVWMVDSSIRGHRWGAAVQGGIGIHFHVTPRLDFSLTSQYMIHLTQELKFNDDLVTPALIRVPSHAFEGHWLTTLSCNVKIGRAR